MPQLVEQGSTVTLDLFTEDVNGDAVDADSAPTASIIDASGDTVVALDAPTAHPALGHYQYGYPVAADAELGAWAIRWFATLDGSNLQTDEGFTVLALDTLVLPVADGQTCQPWATHEDAIGACADYTVDPDELDVYMQIATDVLWNLTGKRWSGICSDAMRPNAQWRVSEGPRTWADPRGRGRWWCSCHRGRDYGCSTVPEIRLPNAPVVVDSVVVRIDGDVLDASAYRVDDGRFLSRIDGDGWPCCQDMRADVLTDENTFGVWWDYGSRPPIGGARAAAAYGCQLFLANNPEVGTCVLPDGVVQVVRQGVTHRFSDPLQLTKDGMTGVSFIDQWVNSILLGNKRRTATAMVPGMHRAGRRTS